jgi:hypothetical protein
VETGAGVLLISRRMRSISPSETPTVASGSHAGSASRQSAAAPCSPSASPLRSFGSLRPSSERMPATQAMSTSVVTSSSSGGWTG